MTQHLSRRNLLQSAAAFGLGVSFLGNVAFAAADSALAKRKLMIVIARGGMDGLSTFPAVGDSNYAALRGPIAVPGFGAQGGALKLDSTFGFHPSLAHLHRLAAKGEARVAPAVATPNRTRSHFEAQDALETGLIIRGTSGWLNRALMALAPGRGSAALSMGVEVPLILRGQAETTTWSPGTMDSQSARLTQVLSDLYAKDALLGPALATGIETEGMVRATGVGNVSLPTRKRGGGGARRRDMAMQQQGAEGAVSGRREVSRALGKAMATLMAADHGPSIGAMSLLGFDTHARQKERITDRLTQVDGTIEGLQTGFGPKWKDTVVVVITEFGRTAKVNGSQGTDHGTASVALLAGGALKPGGIVGDWPTLAQARLFENRDLAPTLDMRGLLKGVLADHLGVDRGRLDTQVFPDSARAVPAANLIG